MKFETFLEANGIKGWKNAHGDLAAIRKKSAAANNDYVLHQLKKDGKESGMHDARTTYATEKEARDKAAYWQKLNPKSGLKYNLYNNSKLIDTI